MLTFENLFEDFLKIEGVREYSDGVNGIANFKDVDSHPCEFGGVIALSHTQEYGYYLEIWSGLGFIDYTFKKPVNSPEEAYNIIKLLLSN